ncbi:MAG: T9SS type A sorting domain-containing protein [Ignavibacteria bacterium]|nr:T9SS type A sorting domain-containing protein [Ignavibacteria bacterium]
MCDDQNGDGYNDILIADVDNGISNIKIFPGGPLMDTIPFWQVKIDFTAVTIDINGDGYRDIVTFPSVGASHLAVYYGGPLLDTIPDYLIQFPIPSSATGMIVNSAGSRIDMNGDGIEELAFWYGQWPNDTLYFYETGSKFTGVPKQRYAGELFNQKMDSPLMFGDINGDGCSDLWIELYDPTLPNTNTRYNVIYGDPEFNLAERFSYQHDGTGYIMDGLTIASRIISDFNGDGKDDWLHPNDGQYLYFYGKMVNSGGYPPTEFPTAYRGLNTQDRGPLLGFKMDVGDVNGDGIQDLMLSIGYSEQWLWLGGIPKWGNTANKKFNGATGRGFVGDVTGDGVDDLALVYDYDGNSYGYGYAVIVAGDRNLVSVGDGEEPQIPNTLRLVTYPNPFNPSTKISYTVPSTGGVTISIYNVSGELIEQRDLGERFAGSYEEEINLGKTGASSGVYFAEITFTSGTDVKKERVKLQLLK